MLDMELKDAESDLTRQHGIGWQTAEQWQALADMLKEYNTLKDIDVSQVFTTQILEKAAQK